MRTQKDIAAGFPGLLVIHQKIPGREVGAHEHQEHEFFMPLQGEIQVHYDNKTVKAGPGRMLYVPPDLPHRFDSSAQGSGERLIWLIEKRLWSKHIGKSFSPSSFPANNLAKELLFYLLIKQKSPSTRHFIAALIETLGDSLNSQQLHSTHISLNHLAGKVGDERIKKALSLIDANYVEVIWSEIAQQSGLSSRNFSRLFLKETGLNPKDYLLLTRMNAAKEFLKTTRKTVTDISMEVGYNSLSKFIEAFKKTEGRLPSDLRK